MSQPDFSLAEMLALLGPAVAADGGVLYMMRFGDVPENDSYDFLDDGIADLIGIPAAEIDHHAWVELMREVLPADPGYAGDPTDYGKAFKRGEVPAYRVRIRVRLRDGREKWISDCSVMVREGGEPIGTAGVLREVSDRGKP